AMTIGSETTTETGSGTVAASAMEIVSTTRTETVVFARTTVTMNEADPTLPCVSVDVQVTVVGPTGNVDPEGGVHVTGPAASSGSTAVGSAYVTGAPAAVVVVTVNDAGTPDRTGGVVSGTLVNVAVHDLSASINTAPLVIPARWDRSSRRMSNQRSP